MADEKGNKNQVKDITDKLEEGLKNLFESEKYKEYLNAMSKFHNYSFNNTLLITMQKPDATLVAGYQAWQKNFERHVNKGEKGIKILAPAPKKIKEQREVIDPASGQPMLGEDGRPKMEEVERIIPAFKAVTVFDVSQTAGKLIPELEVDNLTFDVERYEDIKSIIEELASVPVEYKDVSGDSKGYFDREAKLIVVQQDMPESQTLKTLVHETAHSILHNKEVEASLEPGLGKDRNTREVEAESVAFTVLSHFGIDTADYSFGYIAGWSSDKEMSELKGSLDTIRKTAADLINRIESGLYVLEIEREQEQTVTVEQAVETEVAIKIADRYVSIQETEEGYDYSIYDSDYRLLDGGVYDNPDISIREALDIIIRDDLQEPGFDPQTEMYFRRPIQGEVYIGDVPEDIDYDEFMETVESIEEDRIFVVSQREISEREIEDAVAESVSVVMDFRAKTEEMYHPIKSQTPSEIEETVAAFIQSEIEEYGMDAQVVDVILSGSRCRGLENEGSDLDIVVEYTGSAREDDMFAILNEAGLKVEGVSVDINPIKEGKTGTLETYLPRVEAYLSEKAQQMQSRAEFEMPDKERQALDNNEVSVTYVVSSNSEFGYMGTYRDDITSVDEAIALYNEYSENKTSTVPGIGIRVVDPSADAYDRDVQLDIYSGNVIDMDLIARVPQIYDNTQAMGFVDNLIEKLPEVRIMPVTPEVQERADARRDYNPLAKVEELVEGNYNNIDGIINNLPPKQEETKEQVNEEDREIKEFHPPKDKEEIPKIPIIPKDNDRPSLKKKLATKLKIVAKNPQKEEETKSKDNHREV